MHSLGRARTGRKYAPPPILVPRATRRIAPAWCRGSLRRTGAAVRAGCDDFGFGDGVHRRFGRDDRTAHHADRDGRGPFGAAMGGERLYALSRRPDPRRRSSRRSLRATSDVPGGHCRLRRRVGAMRPFAESELADRGAGGARRLRRLDGAAEPRDHLGIVPGRHPRPCNRHLGRSERAHHGDGAGAGRCADRYARLARGILDQPSDCRRRRVVGPALRTGKPVRQHAGSTRLARRSACRLRRQGCSPLV